MRFRGRSAEDERLRAFPLGLPRPERSVRTSPWLAHIARTTSAGKSWRRVRVVGWPLTEYERYQMIGYRVSAATGDVIRIAGRSAHPELAAPGPGRPPWRLVAISATLFMPVPSCSIVSLRIRREQT